MNINLPDFEANLYKDLLKSSDTASLINCEDNQESKIKFFRYLSKKSLEKKYEFYTSLFEEYTTEKMKLLIKPYTLTADLSNSSLVYGEIDFFSFIDILLRCNIQKSDKFWDLGHGTGKCLISACLMYGNLLSEVNGIEILNELFEISLKTKNNYENLQINHDIMRDFKCSINTYQGDVTKNLPNWTDGNIIFINSTCFNEKLMQDISELCAKHCKSGTRIITLTKTLNYLEFNLYFQIIFSTQYNMSWGAATCYIHLVK